MVRVLAVEPQGPQIGQRATQTNVNPLVSDTTQNSIARRESAIRDSQNILRETASSVSRSEVQRSQNTSQQGGGGGDFLTGLLDTSTQLFDRFTEVQDRQNKRQRERGKLEQAKRDALQKQLDAEKEARRQSQLTELETIGNDLVLSQGQNGTNLTMWGLRQAINDNKYKDINDEDRREMERRFQSAIRRNQDEIVQKVERTQDKVSRARFKAIESTLLYKEGGQLSRLKYETDPTKQQAIVQSLLDEVELISGENSLSDIDRLNLKASVLSSVSKSADVADGARNDAVRQLEQTNQAFNEISALTRRRLQGMPEEQYSYELSQIYAKYPDAGLKSDLLPTLENRRDKELEQASFRSRLQKLSRENYEFENALPVLQNAQVAAEALQIVQDPSVRVKYEVFDTGDNRRILELSKVLERHRNTLKEATQGTTLRKLDTKAKGALAEIRAIEKYRNDPVAREQAELAGLNLPDISDENYTQVQLTYNSAMSEYRTQAEQISQTQSELAKYGVLFDPATGTLGLSGPVQNELQVIQSMPDTGGGGDEFNPNSPMAQFGVGPGFSGAGGTIAQPTQQMKEGRLEGKNGRVQLVDKLDSIYKGHLIDDSPVGSYDFTFIDKNDSDITAIPAPFTGQITEVGTRGGYGYVVAVHDPVTNQEWFMAHLDRPTNLKVGDNVVAGQEIGVQGSSGNSTGPHVHLEIYQGKFGEKGTTKLTDRSVTRPLVDQYFNRATSGSWPSSNIASLGLPPSQRTTFRSDEVASNLKQYYPVDEPTPPGAIPMPGGGYILNGNVKLPSMEVGHSPNRPRKVSKQGSQFGNQRPLTMPSTSPNKRDYPEKNDPTADYGYETIRSDSAFRQALTGVSDRLGVPAQWLADIMAFESTYEGKPHNPRAINSQGAVGLIQFYPRGGLAEVALEMDVTEAEASRRLRNMTAAQQMPWVEKHILRELKYARDKGVDKGINTIGDLFSLIFGGHGLYMKTPAQRTGVSDGNITAGGYLARLGEHVGRSYNLQRGGTATHTTVHQGCPVCQEMMRTQGEITPHAAPR